MAFRHDYLAQLEALPAQAGWPVVRALHLPPLTADSRKWGEFCALELADGSLGLSYVMLDDTLARLIEARGRLGIEGRPAIELARAYRDGDSLARTLGFAAANALTRCLFDRAGFAPPDSRDSIGGLAPAAGDRIGMIGWFAPIAGKIVEAGAQLTVIELREELVGERDGYRITLDAGRLAGCNKVLSTSTLLLNDTLDPMLAHCAGAARFAMIGPSAGCLPDALFARGVTSLGGSWIEERAGFLDALPRGESWSRFARKTALEPSSYPGFAALVDRARP